MRSSGSYYQCPGVLVRCRYCGYTWCYRGSSDYATCPRCARKTPVYTNNDVRTINRLFNRLKAEHQDYFEVLELVRVLLLSIVHSGKIKDSVASELCRLLTNRDANHCEPGGRGVRAGEA